MSGSGETLRRLSDMLQVSGDQLDVCADGSNALQKLWARGYDVIITELGGPGIDGRDLYMALQNTAPQLMSRLVFVCARPTEPLMDFAARTGVPLLQLPPAFGEAPQAAVRAEPLEPAFA